MIYTQNKLECCTLNVSLERDCFRTFKRTFFAYITSLLLMTTVGSFVISNKVNKKNLWKLLIKLSSLIFSQTFFDATFDWCCKKKTYFSFLFKIPRLYLLLPQKSSHPLHLSIQRFDFPACICNVTCVANCASYIFLLPTNPHKSHLFTWLYSQCWKSILKGAITFHLMARTTTN